MNDFTNGRKSKCCFFLDMPIRYRVFLSTNRLTLLIMPNVRLKGGRLNFGIDYFLEIAWRLIPTFLSIRVMVFSLIKISSSLSFVLDSLVQLFCVIQDVFGSTSESSVDFVTNIAESRLKLPIQCISNFFFVVCNGFCLTNASIPELSFCFQLTYAYSRFGFFVRCKIHLEYSFCFSTLYSILFLVT